MTPSEFGPEVRIVQILITENNAITQGKVLGLGSDGVVYAEHNIDGNTGWCVYVKDQYLSN